MLPCNKLQTMELHLLENASSTGRRAGGVLAIYPSGARKVATWVHQTPILGSDAVELGKRLAASLLQACLDERRLDDAERTNWVSVAAACTAQVRAWSDRLGAPEPPPAPPLTERAAAVAVLGMALGTARSVLEDLESMGVGGGEGAANREAGVTPSGPPSTETAPHQPGNRGDLQKTAGQGGFVSADQKRAAYEAQQAAARQRAAENDFRFGRHGTQIDTPIDVPLESAPSEKFVGDFSENLPAEPLH